MKLPSRLNNFWQAAKNKKVVASSIAIIVVVAGLSIVLVKAVTFFAAVEPEQATLSTNAKLVNDAGASAGKAVQFTAPTTPTPPPPTGTCAVSTPHVAGGPDGMGGCWPGETNTGYTYAGTLPKYTGPCTITTPNTVIDSKEINCQILVRANNLLIKNSHLTGGVSGLESDGASFTIEDSNLDNGTCVNCSVDGWNFTIKRTEITGSNRAAYCMHVCRIENSWLHQTMLDSYGEAHASAVRAEQYVSLYHNVLACDYTGPFNNPEVGCSADMSGYPDFAPIHNNTIDSNLFGANPQGLGYCAYAGGTQTKPYSNDPLNATNIVFKNNVFQRGSNGKCGTWGAITAFIAGRTGNQWTNNKWSDGTTVNSEE
jgi:hypothetical protein